MYNRQTYSEAIREADALLIKISKPQNTVDSVQYSFADQEEFLLFTFCLRIVLTNGTRMYWLFGFVYTELKRYDAAFACYVWSLRFEEYDSAINEMIFIQSIRTGNKYPKYLADTIPVIMNAKLTIDNLHKQKLLLFFFNDKKNYLMSKATPQAENAVALHQKLGILKDDDITFFQDATGEAISEAITPKDVVKEKPSTFSFQDFINKYRK